MADTTIEPGTYSTRQFADKVKRTPRTVQLWIEAKKFETLADISVTRIGNQNVFSITKKFDYSILLH